MNDWIPSLYHAEVGIPATLRTRVSPTSWSFNGQPMSGTFRVVCSSTTEPLQFISPSLKSCQVKSCQVKSSQVKSSQVKAWGSPITITTTFRKFFELERDPWG
eukprot:EG_transcript_37008